MALLGSKFGLHFFTYKLTMWPLTVWPRGPFMDQIGLVVLVSFDFMATWPFCLSTFNFGKKPLDFMAMWSFCRRNWPCGLSTLNFGHMAPDHVAFGPKPRGP